MLQEVKVSIRQFSREDIPKKVEWINNPQNNRFLHYDIPLSIERTEKWYDSHVGELNRYDAIIEVNGVPVGTIGLLSIDYDNKKAEYYIAMGETEYKGKGIAKKASRLLLSYGFEELSLNRIYLFTEKDNVIAQRLFEKIGFVKEGIIRQDIVSNGQFVDRFLYSFLKEDWII